MKPLSKQQHDAILSWMENLINRPFREAFAAKFPPAPEAEFEELEPSSVVVAKIETTETPVKNKKRGSKVVAPKSDESSKTE